MTTHTALMTAPRAAAEWRGQTKLRGLCIAGTVTLIVFALQFARAMNRHSDPDEFQFVGPPALLTEYHQLPYVDYPYFHTPNLIFIQALLMHWTSQKLLVARVLSAACGTATLALLFLSGWTMLGELPLRDRLIAVGAVTLLF